MQKVIKIAGGGISGLAAAITLAKAGYEVELHEIKAYCGKHTRDFEYLENWTTKEDALELIQTWGIKTDFYTKPWFKQVIYGPSGSKFIGTSSKPLMYLVKRGNEEDSIDNCLYKQALACKVKIINNSKLDQNEIDIKATGALAPAVLATGIKFPCQMQDASYIILDNELSEHYYSYFIVNDNIGEITACNPVESIDHQVRLQKTIHRFERLLDIKVTNIEHRFTGGVNIYNELKYQDGKILLAGEIAGFQDSLAGFGMRYALRSGVLLAESMIQRENYQQLSRKNLTALWRIAKTNRMVFNKLTNSDYERIIRILKKGHGLLIAIIGGLEVQTMLRVIYTKPLSRVLYFCYKFIPF